MNEGIPMKSGSVSFLIDRISDTRFQGCTDVQSLVECLDAIEILCQTCKIKQCCVRPLNAMKCILEAIVTVMLSRTADLTAAGKCL